jgi:hypothetical protein
MILTPPSVERALLYEWSDWFGQLGYYNQNKIKQEKQLVA